MCTEELKDAERVGIGGTGAGEATELQRHQVGVDCSLLKIPFSGGSLVTSIDD